jgi:hypothetical protein
VLGVVRVARLARIEVRALGGDGLAHDHCAGGAQARNYRGIGARRAPLMQHRAVLGRHVGRVDDVLHAHRNATECAYRLAATAALVCRARLRERMLFVEELPGLHRRLKLPDALQAGAHQLLGAERAARYAARGLGCRELC